MQKARLTDARDAETTERLFAVAAGACRRVKGASLEVVGGELDDLPHLIDALNRVKAHRMRADRSLKDAYPASSTR